MGNTVENFYVESFKDSYGDPQPVEVVAKKSLGDVKLRYRINDGRGEDDQHGEVHGRRALRRGAGALLPPPPWHRHGD